MLDYKTMRDKLKASREKINLRYFTKEFYSIFCEAFKSQNWEPVFSTDFYNMDGGSYCAFLEVLNESLPRWKLTFGKYGDFHWPIEITSIYTRAETEEDAREFGRNMLERYGADYVEATRDS